MSYPTASGYEAYAASVGQSYPLGNQGYQTSGMQQQMPSQVYTAVQNALQAAALEAQQQQQQRYAMANQSYYQNATAAAFQAAAALQQQQQQEMQQKLIQQQLQQQQLQQQQHLQQQRLQQLQQLQQQVQQQVLQQAQQQVQQLQQQQLQQQYARQAQMYQNYPTHTYAMPHTSQAPYQQAPGFPASRSYGAAQTGASGYPPNGATGYSAGWPGAAATADKPSKSPWAAYQPATGSWVSRCIPPQNANGGRQNYYYSSRYPNGNNHHSGYGVSNVPSPAGYRTHSYGQGYSQPGVHQMQSRYPQGR
uniref:Uncharacterized protein n=1 Tax=Rhipicephalus appendiculatus TaxID=34631 RepID=A0A131YES9_RHIAP